MSETITANSLEDKIKDHILDHGPISFAKFMRFALYDPKAGYYKNQNPTFGPHGDFITAPMLGNLFARTLTKQLIEVLSLCDKKVIAEIGPGNGQLAFDILTELKKNDVTIDEYQIFETSPKLIEDQKTKLSNFPEVRWISNWKPEDKIEGCVIANEVADALPAHRFIIEDKKIFSYGVDVKNDELTYIKMRMPTSMQNSILSKIDLPSLPNPYISEYCALLPYWLKLILSRLNKGCFFIFDYGFPSHEFYHPQRDNGTLMCHYRHTNSDNPFNNIGKQDITTHVDFTFLAEEIEKSDYDFAGYTSFAGFLTNLEIAKLLPKPSDDMQQIAKLQKEIFTLIAPSEMGELFKAMAITKSINIELQGFCDFYRPL